MKKQFGYLASLVSRLVSDKIPATGEPMLSGSAEDLKVGDKRLKVSGGLSTGILGSDKLQARVKVGNTVATATDALIKLRVSVNRFVERGGLISSTEAGIKAVKRNMTGKPSASEIAQATMEVNNLFQSEKDHAALFAASVQALVNEATERAAAYRFVILVNGKGETVGRRFGISTKDFGLRDGTETQDGVRTEGQAEAAGNRQYSEFLSPYGLKVRSVTDLELAEGKRNAAKVARDAKKSAEDSAKVKQAA